MGAIVARALNSTLGTENFKSFDELIANNVRLIGSEDTFFVYDGEWETLKQSNRNPTEVRSEYIKFGIGGAVNIYIDYRSETNPTSGRRFLRATYRNGKVIEANITAKSYSSVCMRLNVVEGDEICFVAGLSYDAEGSIIVDAMYIGATVVPCTQSCIIVEE